MGSSIAKAETLLPQGNALSQKLNAQAFNATYALLKAKISLEQHFPLIFPPFRNFLTRIANSPEEEFPAPKIVDP